MLIKLQILLNFCEMSPGNLLEIIPADVLGILRGLLVTFICAAATMPTVTDIDTDTR